MKKYLINIDLDDTLLIGSAFDPIKDSKYWKSIVNIFHKLKSQGHIIVINTGRNWELVKDIYQYLELDTPVSTLNGGYIFHPNKTNFNEQHNFLDSKVLNQIFNQNDTYKEIYMASYTNEHKLSMMFNSLDNITKEFDEILKKFNRVPIQGNKFKGNIYSARIRFNKGKVDLENLSGLLTQDNIGLLYYPDFSTIYDVVEISKAGQSKGQAALYIKKEEKLDDHCLMCIGDSSNDISMMEIADVSVSMLNGTNDLKQICDQITEDTNEEFGLLKFLTKYFSL